MKALIDVKNSLIITTGGSEYGGPWGEMLKDGSAILVDIPEGERVEELRVVGNRLEVDTVKKSARIAKEQSDSNRAARIKATNPAAVTTLPELRAIVSDLVEDWKAKNG